MEGKKTEADYQKQRSDQEPKKEEDILLSCSGLSVGGDKEGLRSMECYEENNDQEVEKGRLCYIAYNEITSHYNGRDTKRKNPLPAMGTCIFLQKQGGFFYDTSVL